MKFKKPKSFDYNVTVIGAGSAGLVASLIAANLKAKVALVERHKMGGDCLNTGCVPSKALIRSAKVVHYQKRAAEFGLRKIDVDFDFAEVMERVQRVVKKIEPHDSVERFTSLGVEVHLGDAKIIDPYRIQAGEKSWTTRAIIVATGARPFVPPLKGLDQIKYLTSDNLWELRTQPKKMIVVGGGPIGCELAQSFHRLGVDVTVVEMNQNLMNREDPDVSDYMTKRLTNEGLQFYGQTKAQEIRKEGDKKFLVVEKNGQTESLEFDEILFAIGRRANVEGFGLQELGIEIAKNGTIEADAFLGTKYSNIFVCGDVTGPFQFTHMASHQAYFACLNSLLTPLNKFIPPPLSGHFRVNYDVVPWCTYTDPEVATVGLTENKAKQENQAYELTQYDLEGLDRAVAEGENTGFVKVLTKPGTDQILGATIVGAHAGELIVEFISAMKQGYGLNAILGTIHIYPTMSEANKFAAGAWKKKNKPETVLSWLQKFWTWMRS